MDRESNASSPKLRGEDSDGSDAEELDASLYDPLNALEPEEEEELHMEVDRMQVGAEWSVSGGARAVRCPALTRHGTGCDAALLRHRTDRTAAWRAGSVACYASTGTRIALSTRVTFALRCLTLTKLACCPSATGHPVLTRAGQAFHKASVQVKTICDSIQVPREKPPAVPDPVLTQFWIAFRCCWQRSSTCEPKRCRQPQRRSVHAFADQGSVLCRAEPLLPDADSVFKHAGIACLVTEPRCLRGS